MKSSLVSFGIAVVVLALASTLYVFAYLRLESDTAHLATLEQGVKTKSALLEQQTRSAAALAGLPTEEANIEQYFVGKQDIVPFLEQLQNAGKPLGATIDVLSVSDATDGTHPRLTLPVTITGSFDAVMRTLGVIENGPYDGILMNVTVNSSPSTSAKITGNTWTVSAILSLGTKTVAPAPKKP